ncbi:AMP-binding protein [Candidatus Woesearchaeota archaeon]|nr:AMP-binding protein [Candidatus Woesearchaeota archaeon]
MMIERFTIAGKEYEEMDPESLEDAVLQHRSLYDIFSMSAEANAGHPAVTFREPGSEDFSNTWSYREFHDTVQRLGQGLIDIGLQDAWSNETESGDRFAVFSPNSPWFMAAEFAVNSAGGIFTPMSTISTPAEAGFVIRDSGAKILMVDGEEQLEVIRQCSPEDLQTLDTILTAQRADPGALSGIGVDQIMPIQFIMSAPAFGFEERASQRSIDDVANMIYSSGTTGNPKGVMLTNRNQASNIYQCQERFRLPARSKSLNILPMYHSYAMMTDLLMSMATGMHVYVSDKDHFQKDMRECPIDYMCAVPLLQKRVYDGICDKLEQAGGLKKLIGRTKAFQYIPLIAKKIQKELVHDDFQFFINGGGGLPVEVAKALKHIVAVYAGYGLTETSPVVSANMPDDDRSLQGSSGRPLVGMDATIKEGEICLRGPNVMKGYWNRPEETASMFDDEGWLHTGDLGHIDDYDHLHITGRIKETIVLATGKNINPTEVEQHFQTDEYINQIYLIGTLPDGKDESYVIAIGNAHEHTLPEGVKDDDAQKSGFLLQRVRDVCSEQGLPKYKIPKAFGVIPEITPDTSIIQDGQEIPVMTGLMKLKRRYLLHWAADVIEQTYDKSRKQPSR